MQIISKLLNKVAEFAFSLLSVNEKNVSNEFKQLSV